MDDDFFSNPELKGESHGGNGYVAVWMDVFFSERNDLIGWYDHDFNESGSIQKAGDIASFSCGETFYKEVLAELEKYPEVIFGFAFLLYDYKYEGRAGFFTENEKAKKGVDASRKALFLGNFKFEK